MIAGVPISLPNTRVRSVSVDISRSNQRIIFEQTRLVGMIKEEKYDVAHFPDYQMPLVGTVSPAVITVHDMVAFKFPDLFPSRTMRVKRFLLKSSVLRANHIIVPSQATRNDLIEILNVRPSKITVIPHGVSLRDISSPNAPFDHRYILSVGTLEPRKNFSRLIKGFASLIQRLKDDAPDLVIAGKNGWMYEDTLRLPQELGIENKVKFLRFVTDSELATLYQHSLGFVYPSLYEGFGLPVLEAMLRGTPVVTTTRGALLEVSSMHAIIVNPEDIEDIASGLERLVNGSIDNQFIESARQYAKSFSWSSTALKTREVFKNVAV